MPVLSGNFLQYLLWNNWRYSKRIICPITNSDKSIVARSSVCLVSLTFNSDPLEQDSVLGTKDFLYNVLTKHFKRKPRQGTEALL